MIPKRLYLEDGDTLTIANEVPDKQPLMANPQMEVFTSCKRLICFTPAAYQALIKPPIWVRVARFLGVIISPGGEMKHE